MKRTTEMTIQEFKDLPHVDDGNFDLSNITSIVILPTAEKHSSGYRCMDVVAVSEGNPICRLSGRSDVVHIEGVGGRGFFSMKIKDWIAPNSFGRNVDCLPVSGLLQLFCGKQIDVGPSFSSFSIYSKGKRR